LFNEGPRKDLYRRTIYDLNNAILNKWVFEPGTYSDARILYDVYIDILNKSTPLPNPIVLFRASNFNIPNIGDEIIEYGFASKTYEFSVAQGYAKQCCMFIISYPANHKFIMPNYQVKRALMEFMSYPGEVIKVDNIGTLPGVVKMDPNNVLLRIPITIVYCHFVRYEPHTGPDGIEVLPPIAGTQDTTVKPDANLRVPAIPYYSTYSMESE
jgi:hypothetical protein